MKHFAHLSKFEETLFRGADWPIQTPHWLLVQLHSGIAYLHGGQTKNEFAIGGVVVIPPNSIVTILASVLAEANLRGCAFRVSSLAGVLTAAERVCLETEAAQACAPFRQVRANEPLAERLGQCWRNTGLNLPARLGLMHAFSEWVAPWLEGATQRSQPGEQRPASRLRDFLNQKPESELTELSLSEVAKHLCCCERHASRVFHEVCGCSFREYISDLRLKKACQMLVHADYKIIDVALESGHSSLALFNYNFKSRFRMTPTEWRERQLVRKSRTGNAGWQAVSL
jgi:AraC-like DNA-binding protein